MAIRNKKKIERYPEQDARELAQLLYDIYVEQKATGKIVIGQKDANKHKKK